MEDDELIELRSVDLGVDSLVSIDLRTWFMKNFSVNVPVLKFMSHDTMGDLVDSAVKLVPPEVVPNITVRSAFPARVERAATVIDWDAETCPPETLVAAATSHADTSLVALDRSIVLLTGASGLLGHHIVNALLEQPRVQKIHCVAVRKLKERLERNELLQDKRICYYSGELGQPSLGLSEDDAARIFAEIGVVIHNGADTSHLKSYSDLKPSNLGSTTELVRLCLPRKIPMHFVSSNAVGHFTNKAEIGEVTIYSPGAPKPPTDGTFGYRSTKWATEVLLERVHDTLKLPISIHRPSTVIRSGKDAEGMAAQLDWMNALIWYMDKLSAVPKLNHNTGLLDLVYPKTVCTGIVAHVLAETPEAEASKVIYKHHMADMLLPLQKLEDFSKCSSRTFRQLPREEWMAEARAAGMHEAVVVLIEMMDAPNQEGPPRFVFGPGTPEEPSPSVAGKVACV